MRYLDRLDDKALQLGRMMQCCAIDPAILAGEQLGQTMAAVARACIACPNGTACRAWLEQAEQRGVNRPPSFCPNAARFRRHQPH